MLYLAAANILFSLFEKDYHIFRLHMSTKQQKHHKSISSHGTVSSIKHIDMRLLVISLLAFTYINAKTINIDREWETFVQKFDKTYLHNEEKDVSLTLRIG